MKYLTRRSGVFAKVSSEKTSEPAISHVVSQLNAICRTASFDFALSVGECVVKNLYHGDLSRFRSRGRSKEQTLRAIATHPDLQMSPGALYRSVAAYELCERLGTQSWDHVSLSHMRLVLPLKPDDQARLLQRAESDRWPVQRLDEEVAALMRAERPERIRGGRRRSTRLHQAIRMVDQSTEQLRRLLESGEDVSADVSAENMRAAVASLQRAADMCRRLQNRLERAVPGAASSPPQPPMSLGGVVDAAPEHGRTTDTPTAARNGNVPARPARRVTLVTAANSFSEAFAAEPDTQIFDCLRNVSPSEDDNHAWTQIAPERDVGISVDFPPIRPASRSEAGLAVWGTTNLMTIARDFLGVSRRIQNSLVRALELLAVPCIRLSLRPHESLDALRRVARQSRELLSNLRSFLDGRREERLRIDEFAAELAT